MRKKLSIQALWALTAIPVACALLAIMSPTTTLAQSCNVTVFAVPYIAGPYPAQPAYIHVGETATIVGAGPNELQQISIPNGVNACDLQNVRAWIVYPDSSSTLFIDLGATLMKPGDVFSCNGTATEVSDPCGTFATTYLVQAGDVGNGLFFETAWPPLQGTFTANNDPQPDTVQYMLAVAGTAIRTGGGVAKAFPAQGLIVLQPCVDITKICATDCTPYGDPIQFYGTISNCTPENEAPSALGDESDISILSVTDDPDATIVLDEFTSTGRPYDGTLLYGESIDYVGFYAPAAVGGQYCGPYDDTITVVAADKTGYTVTDSATATCYVSTDPEISLTKDCYRTDAAGNPLDAEGNIVEPIAATKSLKPGDYYVFSFVVENVGNVPLTNVKIYDSLLPGSPISVSDLAVGGSTPYTSAPILATAANCPLIENSAYATGDNICPEDEDSPCAAAYVATATSSTVTCTINVVCLPEVEIDKEVACALPDDACGTFGETATGVKSSACPEFCYRVRVRNTGIVDLTAMTVTDPVLGGDISARFADYLPLTVGSATDWEEFRVSLCEDTLNTVEVVATGEFGGTDTDTDTANAIVETLDIVCVSLVADPDSVSGSGDVSLTLTLQNNGTVPLKITALNGLPAALIDCATRDPFIPVLPAGVAPGDSVVIGLGCIAVSCPAEDVSLSITADAEVYDPNGELCLYDGQGNLITDSSAPCTATINVVCEPDICVTKEIACAPAAGSDCENLTAWGETATAVVGETEGAFCYKITVWNCGQEDLENVSVTDDLIPAVAGSFPTTLLKGSDPVVLYFKQSYPLGGGNVPDEPNQNLNTVTATGTGVSSGELVSATDTALAVVVPISVVCDIEVVGTVQPPVGDCEATLSESGPVQFTLTIENTGDADLEVTIEGVPPLKNCDSLEEIVIPASVLLGVGDQYVLTGCTDVICPDGAQYAVTVQGTAVASETVPCVYDANGNAVQTAPSTCEACVNCAQEGLFCRTTGGGTLIEGTVDELSEGCVDVETTLHPLSSVLGQILNKVTHGGQLGAPYAEAYCPEDVSKLGNPCIKGQWQHVRHYQGKGNPRDVVSAFHAGGPGKGVFDTLMCACLPCCEDPDGVHQPNGQFNGWEGKDYCNPLDHKVCGPAPRPAPANALIWSGLAQMNQANDLTGKKPSEYVVVRVYIEDRSEPGGNHPKGAVLPSDIYSFQMWRTGVLVSKKPDYSTIAQPLRLAVAQDSCNFLEALKSGALHIGSLPLATVGGVTADVNDQGPLHDGNRQIHPTTSATCP